MLFPQQLWLIHQLMLEPFLNALVRGTNTCGNVLNPNNGDDPMIQDLKHLRHLDSGKYWWLWIFTRFVHSWPRSMMTSWKQQHARSHQPWTGWKNEPCSPTMYFSILIASNPSRCTTFFIALASTSGTPGITTCPRPPWTSDGRMKPAIHSLVETNFALLTFYMIFDLTGSKVKTVACSFRMMSDHLGLTFSLISCAWAAMKPFPTATCFLKLEKVPCIDGLWFFFSCFLLFFVFCLSLTFWILQHLAPAIPWPNVIPCLPVSRILHPPWACHVVIHGDLVIMDNPVALPLLRIHWLRLAVPLILQLPMLDLLPHLQDQVITHPIMGTQRQTWPHPSQLQQITRLQFFPDLQEKLTHSRERWQKFDVSSTHTTLSRFKHLKMTIPNRHFADSWWRKWIDVGTIITGSRSTSSMGSLATFVLVRTVGLTRGINPPNSPTTGVAIFRFQRFPRMTIGFPITTKLQKALHRYKNLAWKTLIPSLPMWTLLHLLSRFTNWQRSSGTFSTMTGMPTWPYSNLSRILMMTFPDTRFRSSRRQIWLTLPVTWRNLHAHCRTKPVAWRHFLTRPCEL